MKEDQTTDTDDSTISLLTLGMAAVALELFTGFMAGLSISSQALHLMGAGLGFGVGVVMLKKGWVDCEGWDLFNVWSGTQNKAREEETEAAKRIVSAAQQKAFDELLGIRDGTRSEARPSLQAEDLFPTAEPLGSTIDREQATAKMRAAITAQDPQTAWALFEPLADDPFASDLPEAGLLRIISLFQRQKRWSASVPAMVCYLQHFRIKEADIRLLLAKVLLQVEKRPGQALAVLDKLNEAPLGDEQRQAVASLRSRAAQLQAADPLRMEMIEDW